MLCVTRNRFLAVRNANRVSAAEDGDDLLFESLTGVEPRTNGGCAEIQLLQLLCGAFHVLSTLRHVLRVTAELLTEGHRHGVLQVGSAGLQHVGELVALLAQPALERARAAQQSVEHQQDARRVAAGNTSLVDCPMLT